MIVMHVYDEDSGLTHHSRTGTGADETASETLLERYEGHFRQRFAADGLETSASFLPIAKPGGKSTKDTILETIEARKADYVVLYPALQSTGIVDVGSLIEGAPCSVIVCKR